MTKKTAAEIVGRETLEETPGRTLKLLRGIGLSLPVRAAMAAKGYSEADHKEGWSLLGAASGYKAQGLDPSFDANVRDAVREIDAWDEDGFRIVRASLTRRHPEQAAQVLAGIGPSTGPAAVVGVETLLDRLDALQKSKSKADHAALETLASRGVDEAERKRLRGLLKAAKSAPTTTGKTPDDHGAADQQHTDTLVALRGWYQEWSEIARAVVKRRDYLILMGLAKRKAPARGATAPAGAAATAPKTNGTTGSTARA